MKLAAILSILLLSFHCKSQHINFTDAEGKKQGLWQQSSSYPTQTIYEKGEYKDNKKIGIWCYTTATLRDPAIKGCQQTWVAECKRETYCPNEIIKVEYYGPCYDEPCVFLFNKDSSIVKGSDFGRVKLDLKCVCTRGKNGDYTVKWYTTKDAYLSSCAPTSIQTFIDDVTTGYYLGLTGSQIKRLKN